MKNSNNNKEGKYFDHARELTKLWNINMTIIPIVISALRKVTKGLLLEDLEITGRVKTIQSTALLRTSRILRRVPGDLRRPSVTETPMKHHQTT